MSVWTDPQPLLLASTSRTRRSLLDGAGLAVEAEAPGFDERSAEEAAAHEALDPLGLALWLAEEKALTVSRRRPGRLVLGADQVLDCEGTIFHKPADRASAQDHLSRLAGRAHALHSAVALAQDGRIVDAFVESARLAMRPLSPDAIGRYLDLAGPDVRHSVGAYQLEGLGIHLFETIEGDHTTILGLPLLARLRRLGYLAF
jgi:septum formation protein